MSTTTVHIFIALALSKEVLCFNICTLPTHPAPSCPSSKFPFPVACPPSLFASGYDQVCDSLNCEIMSPLSLKVCKQKRQKHLAGITVEKKEKCVYIVCILCVYYTNRNTCMYVYIYRYFPCLRTFADAPLPDTFVHSRVNSKPSSFAKLSMTRLSPIPLTPLLSRTSGFNKNELFQGEFHTLHASVHPSHQGNLSSSFQRLLQGANWEPFSNAHSQAQRSAFSVST